MGEGESWEDEKWEGGGYCSWGGGGGADLGEEGDSGISSSRSGK